MLKPEFSSTTFNDEGFLFPDIHRIGVKKYLIGVKNLSRGDSDQANNRTPYAEYFDANVRRGGDRKQNESVALAHGNNVRSYGTSNLHRTLWGGIDRFSPL